MYIRKNIFGGSTGNGTRNWTICYRHYYSNYSTVDYTKWEEYCKSRQDTLAGLSLIAYGVIGEIFYILVILSMYKLSRQSNGFIFLLSQGVIGVMAAVLYTIIPGVIIEWPELKPAPSTWWVGHIIMDSFWFIMVNHYTLVALSRLMAVFRPACFRVVSSAKCYMYCTVCWGCGVVLSVVLHFLPFWVIFHYEPAAYGMDSVNFQKYSTEGTAYVYLVYHCVMLTIPILCYTAIIIRLIIQSKKLEGHKLPHIRHISSCVLMVGSHGGAEAYRMRRLGDYNYDSTPPDNSVFTNNNNDNDCKEKCIQVSGSVESRILVPCVINTLFFVVGQILITLNPIEGKWEGWLIMFVFATNALINSVLLFIFSSPVRQQFAMLCRSITCFSRVVS